MNDDGMHLFDDSPPVIPTGRGGARPGAGRKPETKASRETHDEYSKARAKKEKWLAEQAELKYRVESGQYVPREDVRQATAIAFAAVSQTLRAIPDNLERRLGLAPEVAEEVDVLITEALAVLADDLEKLNRKGEQE